MTDFSVYSFIRLIPFSVFKDFGRTPRYPDDQQVTVTLSELTSEQYNQSLLVFISHCWLRGWSGAVGWDGRAHPDNAEQDKYKLCCEGIEKVMKIMAPGMEECYIWLDYGCIDQEGNPEGELRMLDKIVKVCDCMFTPIYDPNHFTWEMPKSSNLSLYDVYKSSGWTGSAHSYLNRAWCRVEMLYAANIPLIEDTVERRGRFAAGLLFQRSEGRRPHLLYGSKEAAERNTPRILPPLQNSFLDTYNPENGNLTKEKDKQTIRRLMADLQPYIKRVTEGYEGEVRDGKKHGKGKYTYDFGTVYEGEWKDDKKHGKGKFASIDGAVYVGEWKDDKMHGNGKYTSASGAVYVGEYINDKMHGKGKYKSGNGDVYEGEYKADKKHGKGKYTFAHGDVYEGDWYDDRIHGEGKCTYADGGLYEGEWKDCKKHGEGKYTFANGTVYEGNWIADAAFGKGRVVYADGSVYEGGYKDNQKHGRGKFIYANGDVFVGEWKNHLKHGEGILFVEGVRKRVKYEEDVIVFEEVLHTSST